MILLDPELVPQPPEMAIGATAHQSTQNKRLVRLPSVRALSRFLGRAQAAVRLRGAVTVLLTTDREIRRLNRTFRGKNKATDVLSFPAFVPASQRASQSASQRDGRSAGQQLPLRRGRPTAWDPGVGGDLAISVETARRQAAEQGHALAVEVKVLLLHGLLHLAGFDHETDDGQMARRERLLRTRLRLPLGLIERVESTGTSGSSRGSRVKGLSKYPAPAAGKNRKDGARRAGVKVRASRPVGPSTTPQAHLRGSAQDGRA